MTYAICIDTNASPFDTSMALRPIVAEGIASKVEALEVLRVAREAEPNKRFALLRSLAFEHYTHESEAL